MTEAATPAISATHPTRALILALACVLVTGGLLFVAFFLLLVSMGFQRANGLPYYYVGMAVLSLGGAAVAAVTAVTGWRSRRSVRGVLGVVIGALAVPGDLLLGAYAAYAAFHYFVVYATPY